MYECLSLIYEMNCCIISGDIVSPLAHNYICFVELYICKCYVGNVTTIIWFKSKRMIVHVLAKSVVVNVLVIQLQSIQ